MLCRLNICALAVLALLASGVASDGSGINFNMGKSGASIEVKKDDGNPFYYEMCKAGVSTQGIDTGCRRVWKALFYVCIAAGGLLALFLLSCCCCCCCAPCRKNRAVYRPVMNQTSHVVVTRPSYDAPMLQA
ncbi:hypothetical protein BOX15_Mlig019594g2 [Macrostomum lignano]|uniref:Uncharacterized protein n=1 Tax=Macrostomum lignano TaxID=282301 RepID=A0A267GH19_9PLAT|nr:hypothetical protein BOX15_Mlig019594g2 [Macrostomum lignano]